MTPTDALHEYWRDASVLSDVSVIPAPTSSQIIPPTVVLRPDTTWITPSDEAIFCYDHQRYVAVIVAAAASSVDAMRRAYRIAQTIITNLPAGWRFDTVDGLVLDESTGTALIATQVHLSYFNTQDLEES